MQQTPALLAIVMLLWLVFLFISAGTAASEYFSPNVASISKLFKIPHDIAGVTIVAMGNAANDIIGNLVSFQQPNGGSQLAVTEVVGAGLFLNCIVVGTIALTAKAQVKMKRGAVVRDELFYAVGLLILGGTILSHGIPWFVGALLLLTYCLYATVILVMTNPRLRTVALRVWRRLKRAEDANTDLEANTGTNELQEVVMGIDAAPPLFPVIRIQSVEDDGQITTVNEDDVTLDAEVDIVDIGIAQSPSDFLQVPTATFSPPLSLHAEDLTASQQHSPSSLQNHHLEMIPMSHNRSMPPPVTSSDNLMAGQTLDRYRTYEPFSNQSTLRRQQDLSFLPAALRDYVSDDDEVISPSTMRRRSSLMNELSSGNQQSSEVNSVTEASETVLSLRFHEAMSLSRRNMSMSSAMELWQAVNQIQQQDDRSASKSAVFSLGITRQASPEPNLAEQQRQLEVQATSRSSSPVHSDRGEPQTISFDVPPAMSSPAQGSHRRSLASASSHGRIYNYVSLLNIVDYCSVCLRQEDGQDTSVKLRSQLLCIRMHLFPIVKRWTRCGHVAKVIELLNVVPIFCFGLTVPLIALMDTSDDSPDLSLARTLKPQLSANILSPSRSMSRHPSTQGHARTGSVNSAMMRNLNEVGQVSDVRRQRSRTGSHQRVPSDAPRTASPQISQDQPSNNKCRYGSVIWIPWRHRYISIVQVFIAPVFTAYALELNATEIFHFQSYSVQAWILCLVIGLVASMVMMLSSLNGKRITRAAKVGLTQAESKSVCDNMACLYCCNRRPMARLQRIRKMFTLQNYHYSEYYPYLCIVGFVTGLMWIYIISSEIVATLKTLGHVLNISDSILGVTVFAFGNSVGDFATDYMIARLFYPSMAVGAAWCAPLINLYMTISISSFVVPSAKGQSAIAINYTPILATSILSLLVVVSCNLLWLGLWNKFKLTRNYGKFLIGWWIGTVALCIILEATVQ